MGVSIEHIAFQYLDFEAPIKAIQDQIDEMKEMEKKSNISLTDKIALLEEKLEEEKDRKLEEVERKIEQQRDSLEKDLEKKQEQMKQKILKETSYPSTYIISPARMIDTFM